MAHPIFRVVAFAIVAPYTLRVTFDDTTTQVIDFAPILAGELYGPLRDEAAGSRRNRRNMRMAQSSLQKRGHNT